VTSRDSRLRRLEAIEEEQAIIAHAQRLAERHGLDVEAVMEDVRETAQRVARYGHDAEIRRLAQEFGKTEEDIRAQLDALMAEEEAPA